MASIDHNHASASRGVGVIMGDKRLKAIAVRGTRDLNIARPAELFELTQALHKKIGEGDGNGDWMAVDEDDSFHHNHFAWGNARTRRKNFWSDELQERWTKWKYDHMDRQTGCFNCPKKCRNVINWPGRPRFGYKCFGKDTYHMAAFLELDFTYEILGVAQEYGLDSYSTPQVIAFALELLEAGILTDKDFPEMPADSRGRFFYLLEKIVRREGIGDVLADSVSHAAKRIGNGAEALRPQHHEEIRAAADQAGQAESRLLPHDRHRREDEHHPDRRIVSRRTRCPRRSRGKPSSASGKPCPTRSSRNTSWNGRSATIFPIEATCEIVDWNEAMHYIDDSTGLCGFVSSFRGQFGGGVAYHMNNIPQMISHATGMEMDKERLWKTFQRIRTLVRAVNVRRGLRRKDERPPEDHWAVRDEKYEQELLSKYYAFKGWNSEGIPTRQTLEQLDLGYAADDLERRGILTADAGVSACEPGQRRSRSRRERED